MIGVLRDSSGVPIVYYVFDVLVLEGQDVMGEPLFVQWDLLRAKALSKLDEPIRESPEFPA